MKYDVVQNWCQDWVCNDARFLALSHETGPTFRYLLCVAQQCDNKLTESITSSHMSVCVDDGGTGAL